MAKLHPANSTPVNTWLMRAMRNADWFAAYTMSRHEKRIASHCERIGIEQFLPLYTSQRSWKNRTTVDLQMPLFPNYIFVRLLPQDHGPLMRLPGLLSLSAMPQGRW